MKKTFQFFVFVVLTFFVSGEIGAVNFILNSPKDKPPLPTPYTIYGTTAGGASKFTKQRGVKAPVVGFNPAMEKLWPNALTGTETRSDAVYAKKPGATYFTSIASGTRWHQTEHGRDWDGFQSATTNHVLHNRDGSNAAWTKTNMEASKVATGIDGSENSGTSITATANNGKIIQAITLNDSQTKTFSVFVKRLAGSGNVYLTMDDGTNTYDITSSISTGSWYTGVTTQGNANPSVGIILGTSGDAVEFDFAQLEPKSYESQPIETAGSIVLMSADQYQIPISYVSGFMREDLREQLWTTDPKKDLPSDSDTDTFTNPGVSLVDSGKTNFQGGSWSWNASGSNILHAELDPGGSGVSVLAIGYVSHSSGGNNGFLDSKDLTADLTDGNLYRFTATVKINTGSANVQINRDTSDLDSRAIVETEWTGVTIYFEKAVGGTNYVDLNNLSSGETFYIREWDLREVQTRSILGDQEGDPEITVNGGFEEEGSGNPWIPSQWTNSGLDANESGSTTVSASGTSAWHLNVSSTNEGIYQAHTISGGGLVKISGSFKCISGYFRVYVTSASGNSGFVLGNTPGGYTDHTWYWYMPTSDSTLTLYARAVSGAAQWLIDDISVQKVNTAWTPYGSNTLELDETGGGVSVTYVDNASGASIFLDSASDLDSNPTVGDTYKITFDAYEDDGDVQVKIDDGAGNADVTIDLTTSNATYNCYLTVAGVSPYLYFAGMAGSEEATISNLSMTKVHDSGTDGEGSPEGTLAAWILPAFNMDDVSAYHGLITSSDAATGPLYVSSNGRFTAYDGTNSAYESASGVSRFLPALVAVEWGYLSNGVAKMRVGTDYGSGMSWATATDYDGAFPIGSNLNVFYGGLYKYFLQFGIWDETGVYNSAWGRP